MTLLPSSSSRAGPSLELNRLGFGDGDRFALGHRGEKNNVKL
jgi:hypothetical protein